MRTTIRFAVPVLTAAMVLSVLSLSGCGGDGFGTRHKISGTVTYKGAPVAKGDITFHPVDLNKSGVRQATGPIKDGKYTLSTANAGSNDGALPGDYNVTIISRDVPDVGSHQGGAAKQDDVAKANAKAKKLVPSKYEIPSTTPLTNVKVPGGKYDFELVD